MSLSLSVVVCAHNRPTDLGRCMDALGALIEPPDEVIVVDSASQPPCRDLVRTYAAALPRLRYVREEAQGLSRARNQGLSLAQGEIIAFLDDDVVPRPTWGRSIRVPFERDPTIGCVGGACAPVFREQPRPHWLSDRLLQFAGITHFGTAARTARSSAEWPFGANMAFRREALSTTTGFPEQLGRVGKLLLSGEESAVIESMRRSGWAVWLEPAAIVDHTVHAERCVSSYYWKRLWWTGVSRARYADRALVTGLRLVPAAFARAGLYVLTRDRVHLYRTAETAGYLAEKLRLRGGSV